MSFLKKLLRTFCGNVSGMEVKIVVSVVFALVGPDPPMIGADIGARQYRLLSALFQNTGIIIIIIVVIIIVIIPYCREPEWSPQTHQLDILEPLGPINSSGLKCDIVYNTTTTIYHPHR